MSDERRYHESEIRQIFEIASLDSDSAEHSDSSRSEMTLRELQDIGSEVGLAPERIEWAARSLDSPAIQYRRWPMGVPIGLSHMVELPRPPTSEEWDVLVSRLRETFDASGRVESLGATHRWSNGNLHVFAEPTARGYRLRMRTRKASAVALTGAGVVGIGWSIAAAIGLSMTGDLSQAFLAPALVGLAGMGSLMTTFVRLPPWARTRALQMESIGHFAQSLLSSSPEPR